jgi:hypothetical protein
LPVEVGADQHRPVKSFCQHKLQHPGGCLTPEVRTCSSR